jgi:small membrane protein
MLIKLLLILAVVALLAYSVRGRPGVRLQAGKRIGLVLFAAVNVVAVLRPDDVSDLAHALGVGRGTDLVLYGLVIAFFLGTLSTYMRFKVVDRRFTELARVLAIREAEIVNRERGVIDGAPAEVVVVARPEDQHVNGAAGVSR